MPFGELLKQHRIGVTLVAFHRERLTSTRTSGVIRQFSKRLILVELFGEARHETGFTLIRRDDLTRLDANTATLRRSLPKSGSVARSHPITREIDLTEWRTAIASAQVVASSLALHREGVGDPITLAAPSIKLFKHLVIGNRPESDLAEDGEFALALDHITRIDLVN